MKTARRFAKRGIASLQVRINNVEFSDTDVRNDTYARNGVDFCQIAMDHLADERSTERFILMGNCACASFCFNAAIEDPRVVGLILTNPHITKRQLLSVSLWYKLTRPGTLRRLLTGGINVGRNIRVLSQVVRRRLAGQRRRQAAGTSGGGGDERCDYELPDDLVEKIEMLDRRGVKTLFACAASDDSLHYLQARYGAALPELEERGAVRFERIDVGTHVFSRDDSAAALLNEAISRWVEGVDF